MRLYSDLAVRHQQRQLALQVAMQREATASLFDKKAGRVFAQHIEEMIGGQREDSQHPRSGP